jgi:hypothetical protein
MRLAYSSSISMFTTHIFHRGSRRCLNCGLEEDAVEFKRACPSPKAMPAVVDVEQDFFVTATRYNTGASWEDVRKDTADTQTTEHELEVMA